MHSYQLMLDAVAEINTARASHLVFACDFSSTERIKLEEYRNFFDCEGLRHVCGAVEWPLSPKSWTFLSEVAQVGVGQLEIIYFPKDFGLGTAASDSRRLDSIKEALQETPELGSLSVAPKILYAERGATLHAMRQFARGAELFQVDLRACISS